jgi:hypothetical protein
MNQSANVRSIDAIKDFRVALSTFKEGAAQSLAAVAVEIQRTLDWLGHDQLKYWQNQVRVREDRVNEAKVDLNRCLISTTATGDRPACSDQRLALAKAKARLAEAEEKIEKVRHWCQVIEQDISDYHGPAQQLASMLDHDLPKAMSLIERMINSLEEYVGVAPTLAESSAVATSTAPQADPDAPPDAMTQLAAEATAQLDKLPLGAEPRPSPSHPSSS